MKNKSILFLLAIFLFAGSYVYSQTAQWNQLADFPGGVRTGAFGFTIGNKYYLGGGSMNGTVVSDFWEYNLTTGVWTRKADFGGGTRYFAFAFSIGSKGYAGTGAVDNAANTLSKDFWQYDPATNKWSRKADFGGGMRQQAFGSATSAKGYAGTGLTSKDITSLKSDFWEYNPGTNKWNRRSSISFIPRFGLTSFSLNGKIYAGTGIDIFAQTTKDFYEYNPASNRWKRKAAYGGTGVYRAVAFTIGNTGYIGTGYDGKDFHNDFWSYNVAANKWTKAVALPAAPRTGAVAFGANNNGYVLTGLGDGGSYADVWKLTAASAAVMSAADGPKINVTATATAIKIFPNPAASQFTISLHKGDERVSTAILIYNMQGKLAAKYDLGNSSGNFTKTIDIPALATGMYQVVIERGALRESTSLMVVK